MNIVQVQEIINRTLIEKLCDADEDPAVRTVAEQALRTYSAHPVYDNPHWGLWGL
jgi:hypothetical protein